MTEQLKTSIKVSQQSSNCSDSRTSFMGGTARGSFEIQGQNISKDQSYKSNPQMHILHLSTSFYLCLSACWNLWVTENNSGKQDSLKVGDVFQKRYNRYRYISQACESAGGLANESVIVSHYTALIIRQIILLCVLYVACLMSMGGSSQMTRQEEEKLILRWVTEREGMYVNVKKIEITRENRNRGQKSCRKRLRYLTLFLK